MPDLPDPDALLSTAEAAALLRVSPRTLQTWRGTGEGPAFVRMSQNRCSYTRAALAAFVESRTRVSTTEEPDLPRYGRAAASAPTSPPAATGAG